MKPAKHALEHPYRINRYIMECKWLSRRGRQSYKVELIDTLWNVNTIDVSLVVVRTRELIDTLWNVNKIRRKGIGRVIKN